MMCHWNGMAQPCSWSAGKVFAEGEREKARAVKLAQIGVGRRVDENEET